MSAADLTPQILVRELIRLVEQRLSNAPVPILEGRRHAMPATANPGRFVEHRLLRDWIRLDGRARVGWPLDRRELELPLDEYSKRHLVNAARILSTEILRDRQARDPDAQLMTTWRHVAEPWSSRCEYRGLSLIVYRRGRRAIAEILWGWR